jgi:hypothetical protein
MTLRSTVAPICCLLVTVCFLGGLFLQLRGGEELTTPQVARLKEDKTSRLPNIPAVAEDLQAVKSSPSSLFEVTPESLAKPKTNLQQHMEMQAKLYDSKTLASVGRVPLLGRGGVISPKLGEIFELSTDEANSVRILLEELIAEHKKLELKNAYVRKSTDGETIVINGDGIAESMQEIGSKIRGLNLGERGDYLVKALSYASDISETAYPKLLSYVETSAGFQLTLNFTAKAGSLPTDKNYSGQEYRLMPTTRVYAAGDKFAEMRYAHLLEAAARLPVRTE